MSEAEADWVDDYSGAFQADNSANRLVEIASSERPENDFSVMYDSFRAELGISSRPRSEKARATE